MFCVSVTKALTSRFKNWVASFLKLFDKNKKILFDIIVFKGILYIRIILNSKYDHFKIITET